MNAEEARRVRAQLALRHLRRAHRWLREARAHDLPGAGPVLAALDALDAAALVEHAARLLNADLRRLRRTR